MEINKFIKMGVEKTGSQRALAKALDIDVTVLSAVKAGKRGLSNVSCIKLADLINVEKIEVIAASELVTEKDENKRKIFESCFSTAASIAAAAIVISILTLPLQKPASAQEISLNLPNYKLLAISAGRIKKEKRCYFIFFR